MSSIALIPSKAKYTPPPSTEVEQGVEDFLLTSTEEPNVSSYIGFSGEVEDFPITIN